MTKENLHLFSNPTASGCLIWQRAVRNGYGTVTVDKVKMQAHCRVYQLFKGEIPAGLFVCHSCDTPLCINPEHLHLGTALTNNLEAKERNRIPLGSEKTMAKLDEIKVAHILERIKAGDSIDDLAAQHGVSYDAVYAIHVGRTWKHVKRPDTGHKPWYPKISEAQRRVFDSAQRLVLVWGRR